MKTRSLFFSIASIAASALVAASAQATMVAGWDFSQYLGDGLLSVDGATFTDTLSANYSDLDPTFNAGAESAAFGTLYMDGQFGSSNIGAGSGSEPILPTAGSLTSNLTAPLGGAPGSNPFDSFSILLSEGQAFANPLAMTANAATSIVFSADLTSVGSLGSDWSVSFGGKTFSGTASLGIDFSTDGVNFTPFGTVDLTTNDTPYMVSLGSASSDVAYVRFDFASPSGPDQAILDNVAFSAGSIAAVPEPGTVGMLLAGLAGLVRLGRRRS